MATGARHRKTGSTHRSSQGRVNRYNGGGAHKKQITAYHLAAIAFGIGTEVRQEHGCHDTTAWPLSSHELVERYERVKSTIVDFTRSPLYKLSGYLHQVLSPLAGHTTTHVENASAFVGTVRDLHLSDDDVMVSFDVTSLCTSVPIDSAIETCKEALSMDASLADRTPLDPSELFELLHFC
ncbi:hypothetical protein HPB49_012697 [Dermacentor silvarum]|uniref:Uncharacterized protein n=1 Tax=Dermacentor silvarum TaxID=543639 RepID=A0ACB8D5J9_DERSI|nr:hypothetical protein HPB49_012697 [Dermacentor silvarum]